MREIAKIDTFYLTDNDLEKILPTFFQKSKKMDAKYSKFVFPF